MGTNGYIYTYVYNNICMYFRFHSICVNPIPHVPGSILKDEFGNYVMQHVLEHGEMADRIGIIYKLRGQLTTLSQHKYAR